MPSLFKRERSDDSYIDPKEKSASRTNPNPRPPYQAKVKELAANEHQTSASGVDDYILESIKKCLDRPNHPITPELEAKAALFLSSRLMSQA